MRLFYLGLLCALSACASPLKSTGILAPTCGPTSINVKDTEALGFTPAKNKVTVMRVFASWCPYCKEDLAALGAQFKKGAYTEKDTQVFLLAYRNRREDKASYDEFVRELFPHFGIPKAAAQIVFIDKDYAELAKTKTHSGEELFTGWQGVPFGLVFGKDGRLAFRGHFTNSSYLQDQHYVFIRDLVHETCPVDKT